MSTSDQDTAAAAAAGAAAAVNEVQDQQAEAENREAVETSAIVAGEAAEQAEAQAAQAAEVATQGVTEALTAADTAVAEAGQAEAVATTAVAEATEARSEVADMQGQFASLRQLLEERLPQPASPSTQPEEVTVGDNRADQTAESATNRGSDSSAESGAADIGSGPRRIRGHRFGGHRS